MNKIMLILASVVPIGGLAAGGMVAMGVPPLGTPAAVEERPAPAALAPPPAFVDVGIVGVPIIEDRRIVRNLILQLSLDVAPEAKPLVEEALPRLQNNFLSELLGFMPGHMRDRDQVDLAVVKRRLTRVCERLLGHGVVRDVLVTGLQER